jgi:Ran GTPase-activating protein (RanGAP) involved in mRNA processing and transport
MLMVIERISKKSIVYAGIEEPTTSAEIKVEILGLQNAIKQAEEMISRYQQVFAVRELQNEERQHASQTKSDSETQEGTEEERREE